MDKVKFVCINLERRPDRKQNFLKQNVPAEFYPAVDGKKLVLTDEIKTLFEGNDFGWRRGVIGCALSHFYLWKQLLEDPKYDYYAIVEDDTVFIPNFLNIFSGQIDMIVENDLKFVFLGFVDTDYITRPFDLSKDPKVIEFNRKIFGSGTGGYLVSKKGAKSLVDFFTKNGIKQGIDSAMKDHWFKTEKLYTFWPRIIISPQMDTDIQRDFTSIKKKTLVVASEGMGSWCKDFFTHIAKIAFGKDVVIEYKNAMDAQILLRSFFFGIEKPFPKKIPYIAWSGESYPCSERDYPPLYNVWKPDDPNQFKIAYIIVAFFELQKTHNIKFNLKDLRLGHFEKPYFLAYCSSDSTPARETLFKLIKERDQTGTAHGLGRCHTTPGYKAQGGWQVIHETYKKYRFVFAMENGFKKYYVTEKLITALISGAIPIYFGDSDWVKEVFNEKCIIFTADFNSLEECADYIMKVETTPSLYQKYLDEPRFVKKTGYFDIDNPCEEYLKMAEILKSQIIL
jgi:GR25 family glycosyltransferase involved in LPS biosynthesis